MVGSLGTESLTAVSISGQLIFVFFLAVFGWTFRSGNLWSTVFRTGQQKGFQNVFRLKLWITAVIVLVGMTVFVAGGEQLIGLYLHGSSQGMDAAGTVGAGRDYLHIMLFGLIPFAFTQIYAGSLREMGESMKPMVAGIVSVFVDIIFNYLLIYGEIWLSKAGRCRDQQSTVMARFVEMLVVVVWTYLKYSEI